VRLGRLIQGTAAYDFLQAYHAYVRALSLSERDRYYAEGIRLLLSTVRPAPTSEADLPVDYLYVNTAQSWAAPVHFSRSRERARSSLHVTC
jgi:hypothetical protein